MGHHLSLNIAIVGGHIAVTPCFFGANPATVRHSGVPVPAPLTQEEHLARSLLRGLTPAQRGRAALADTAPRTRHRPRRPGSPGRGRPARRHGAQLLAGAPHLLG